MDIEAYAVHLTRTIQRVFNDEEMSGTDIYRALEEAMAECPADFEETMKKYPKNYKVIFKEI